MKNTLNVENLKSHLIVEDKATIEGAAAEGLQLIESDPQDAADAINTNQKEIYDKFNPIMMRVYQAAGVFADKRCFKLT